MNFFKTFLVFENKCHSFALYVKINTLILHINVLNLSYFGYII